ncbi:tryptophan synthase subunit beta [Leptolyngbya cf. ectocarpi LEGE 11479]|uniref:Tryptophan synthase beta chain n=1 Tax=Leptolyngbya cf. ectocarpi LEGE 11479 TaxID=1828722 RepID=A0A929A0I6_LEPEC|nr:tryptophan synthase subunit beta [Leptolyngbya ectocarpi]MBE9070934.1 tryptophan synthase subunit beta [Leptolyngbya cf. ectocarpi LEGE 11479]
MTAVASPLLSHQGYYGEFGGRFIPEILYETFESLTAAYHSAREDPEFWQQYVAILSNYSCRPTPLTYADGLTRHFGGAKIYIKREDLNHTGSHKLNNVLGQTLLAQRMGKCRLIAETGAGQHGMATATLAAKFGLECTIYMGAEDVERQCPNVFWMRQLGAEVIPVTSGTQTLKDAMNEALRDWSANMATTHYLIGTACGPHPFPEMVAWFQSVIGQEVRSQILTQTQQLPKAVYACVGGGSNAIGIFSGFLEDAAVDLVGVEAGGLGTHTPHHASRLSGNHASTGIAQGYKTQFLQNSDGQMQDTHSVAAGLDYVGVSPILAHLAQTGRIRVAAALDADVIAALRLVIKKEGLIPALESAHAFVQAFKEAPNYTAQDAIIISQSGRGDKDIFTIAEALQDSDWQSFLKQRVVK